MTDDVGETRPGLTYYAPEVRLVALGELTGEGEEGRVLDQERRDVLDVEVNLVHTGSGQYTIVLNNWQDTLTGRRQEGRGGGSEAGAGAAPPWPPYKYNDFSTFRFGRRLRLDMRYWPEHPTGLNEAQAAAHTWVPIIAGPITDMRFSFAGSEGSRLTLVGEDDLYLLKKKSARKVVFRDKTEEEIIRAVLSPEAANYPLSWREPQIPWPDFFTDRSNAIADTLQEGQSYLEFLQKIAKRFDCEVFVEFNELSAEAPAVGFHFETARSRVPVDTTIRDIYVLSWGQNLIDFQPTFSVFDQYTQVTVWGRHRIRQRPRRVMGQAGPDDLAAELPRDAARGDAEVVPAPTVRQHFFGATHGPNDPQPPNQTNLDEARANEMARATLREKARQFLTITATTIGLPQLRPGRYVEIRGLRPPFDGFYYVTRSTFRFGAGGFTTQLTARRPGMPLPPYDED